MIANVFNDAWADNWGFVPLTVEEVAHMAKELKPFIGNESMTVIEVDGEPQAFAFALPNLLELSDGLDGRLLPFGWARVLARYLTRPIRSERVALMGVSAAIATIRSARRSPFLPSRSCARARASAASSAPSLAGCWTPITACAACSRMPVPGTTNPIASTRSASHRQMRQRRHSLELVCSLRCGATQKILDY